MKAAVYHAYKLPDVVRIEDVAKPAPKDDEVLVRVRAASVNPLDAGLMKGKPLTFRLLFGLSKPRLTRPGVDVAGDVEAVGAKATRFKAGDQVFGFCRGAFAEYVCTAESKLVIKPPNVTYEVAASQALLLSPLVRQRFVTFIAKPRQEDLRLLRELMSSGMVKPVIDRCYQLSEVSQAIRYLDARHARGKVVIRVP